MRFFRCLIFLLIVCCLTACSTRTKYNRKLKAERSSGIRHDSLFMGLYLGMTQKDFYSHCWALNKKGLIRQSSTNTSVEYEVKDELKHEAILNFYPNFVQGKIYEMPVRFVYKGWAPWNKKYSADSLQLEVLKWYKSIYGNDFLTVKHPSRGKAFVKIDGNRRITIFKQDDLQVWAVFTDMSVPEPKIGKSRKGNNKSPEFNRKFKP